MEAVKAQVVGLVNNVEAPAQQEMTGGPSSLDEAISNTNHLKVFQKFSLIEGVSQGCCEMSNQYTIMNDKDEHVMTAQEKSPGCARCCCAPNHSTLVYIKKAGSDETWMTIERPGCGCPPKKCIGGGCPTLPMDCCKDGITVYDGYVEGEVGDLQNAPAPIVMLKESTCGGDKCMWPKLYVQPGMNDEPTQKIVGPWIFGGCSELCCESTFKMDTIDDKNLANIRHLTPKTCADIMKEICTDTDKFQIDFTSEASKVDKKTALASALLIDYMFFEMDNGMVACKNGNQLDITCCFFNCMGCQCPCKIICKKQDKGGQE